MQQKCSIISWDGSDDEIQNQSRIMGFFPIHHQLYRRRSFYPVICLNLFNELVTFACDSFTFFIDQTDPCYFDSLHHVLRVHLFRVPKGYGCGSSGFFFRLWMILYVVTMSALIRRMWMNPPKLLPLINPKAHIVNSAITINQFIRPPYWSLEIMCCFQHPHIKHVPCPETE